MTDTAKTKPVRTYPKARPKVPAFARYSGTSCWRSDKKRVRAFNLFKAAQHAPAQHDAAPHA